MNTRFYCIFGGVLLGIIILVSSFTYVIKNEREKAELKLIKQANEVTIVSQEINNKQQKEITKQNNKLQLANNKLNKQYYKDIKNIGDTSNSKNILKEMINDYKEFESIK